MDMPVEKQNENLCLNFAAFLKGHNPKLHTNFDITESELIATYCYGLHPEAKSKIEANNMRSNTSLAIRQMVVATQLIILHIIQRVGMLIPTQIH